MFEVIKGIFGFFKKEGGVRVLPQGFFIEYVSGPSLGCDYYEARAFFDGVLVAESHGHIFPGCELRVTKILVYADYRRKGFGRKLCSRFVEEAEAAGCKSLIFEGVDLYNAEAVNLYKSLGACPGKSKTYPSKKDFSLLL
ncbi:GNAT family N-acetyltransferase [Pseudomonas corrugata]|uniref:GNAT family N-acetyltransferase n=1 Tax=Pseudomonas corrugata TaxID=47879 RepID=UPI0022321C46|nr:GNAT family N-acetyltransferase [Pseudomonas corrugata]UZD94082.1 GNAT family N-acetyltransferase [Pseudomonas corrugata]